MTRPKRLRGATMREVTEKTFTGRHAVYNWMRAGLLPKAPRGRGARYEEDFVARALAIAELRREGWVLEAIRRHLEANPPSAPRHEPAPSSERWERIVLQPGLEVSYRADAAPVLRRLATEIWKQFGATAPA